MYIGPSGLVGNSGLVQGPGLRSPSTPNEIVSCLKLVGVKWCASLNPRSPAVAVGVWKQTQSYDVEVFYWICIAVKSIGDQAIQTETRQYRMAKYD